MVELVQRPGQSLSKGWLALLITIGTGLHFPWFWKEGELTITHLHVDLSNVFSAHRAPSPEFTRRW